MLLCKLLNRESTDKIYVTHNPLHLNINILSYFFLVFSKCIHKHDSWFWVFELLSKILIILYSLLGLVFDLAW